MGWDLDLRRLYTYVVAARTLNFHQAAQRLYLAQPTVTSHIRQLEAELGTRLFDRTGRRVRLTAAGERFLPHALRVLDEYEEGVQDLSAWRQGYGGSLRILCSPLVGASTLPEMLRQFTREHPDVEVKVSTADSPEVVAAIAAGRFDVGLTRLNPASADLVSLVLHDDPVLLVGPPSLAGDGNRPWAELIAAHTLLIRNHPVYWDDLLLELHQRDIPLRTMAVSHVHVTKRLVEEGLGLSFLPRTAVEPELLSGALVEVPTPGFALPTAHTYLVYSARRPAAPALTTFQDTLHALYPNSPAWAEANA